MLPSGKFFDDESSSILREIKEKEKLMNEKGIAVPLGNQFKSSSRSVLPPLKVQQKVEVKRTKSNGYASQLSDSTQINIINKSALHSRSDDSIHSRNYETMSKDRRQFSRKLSFDRPNSTLANDAHWYDSHMGTVTRSGRVDQINTASGAMDQREFPEGKRRHYDFDAYLKHAVEKREEDRLFKKESKDYTIECASDGRRKERPKTAHYGRQRTQPYVGNI